MTLRVLIVDDNRELAENIGEILEDEGYEVAVVDDPRAAIEKARHFHYDVAILDVRMPGMDGVDLHHELVRTRPCARYLLMTAFSRDERIDDALRSGVRSVLPKPVPIDLLLRDLPGPDADARYVLIVEDDVSFGANLAEILEEAGYRARCAVSAAVAREVVAEDPPSAIIADIVLPDADGIELADELAQKVRAPVLLMTAYSATDAERIVHDLYGDRAKVLHKPFRTDVLLDTLAALRIERGPPA